MKIPLSGKKPSNSETSMLSECPFIQKVRWSVRYILTVIEGYINRNTHTSNEISSKIIKSPHGVVQPITIHQNQANRTRNTKEIASRSQSQTTHKQMALMR